MRESYSITHVYGPIGTRKALIKRGKSPIGEPWVCIIFDVGVCRRFADFSGNERAPMEMHRVVAWQEVAEALIRVIRPGLRVLAEGRLEARSWISAKDGNRYHGMSINAFDVIIEPSEEILMSVQLQRRIAQPRISARCTEEQLAATQLRAKRLGLTVTEYVLQQTDNMPMTSLYVRLPRGDGWAEEWTEIEEDNLDGTYTPLIRKGAPPPAPVAWKEGQPYAVYLRGRPKEVPRDAERPWTASPLPP